jgi:hypothetical protein
MHYQATFVGFVPAEAPALSIIVVIDEPTKEGIFGGVVAAPAFAKIGETALRHYTIPPPASDLAAQGLDGDVTTSIPIPSSETSTTLVDSTVTRTESGRLRGPAAGTPPAGDPAALAPDENTLAPTTASTPTTSTTTPVYTAENNWGAGGPTTTAPRYSAANNWGAG